MARLEPAIAGRAVGWRFISRTLDKRAAGKCVPGANGLSAPEICARRSLIIGQLSALRVISSRGSTHFGDSRMIASPRTNVKRRPYGRGAGVGRGRGVGVHLPVHGV